MPSPAHVCPPELSIASIVLLAAGIAFSSAAFAAEAGQLPELGNTEAMDREFSREVADDYVYDRSAASRRLAQPLPETPETDPVQATAEKSKTAIPATAPENAAMKVSSGAESEDSAAPADPWKPLFNEEDDPSETAWQRIAKSDRLPLHDHERVQFYTDQYLRESLWISKILRRSTPFLAHLVATLDQRFMPVELALLPAIESGYLPTAKSAGSAVGLWQIVPITAREIGIERDVWFDGRGDILTSTTAAIDYLSYLNAEFNGDWELTLAAYNAGPGRVRAAIKKNADAGLETDYWSLDLPRETQNYVPKLIALVGLIKQKDHGGFDMPDIRMEPAFESIDIGFRVSIDRAAKIADIDEELLRSLNAGLIHGVTAPDGPHHLLIPAGTGEKFQQAFAGIDKNTVFSEPKTHAVVSGDTISSIALKYGISQRRLLEMNGLDNSAIRIGQKLAVIDARNIPDSVVEYVVSIGDTLSEIADSFDVSVDDIRQADGKSLDGDIIHPGDTLNIVVSTPASG